MAELALDVGDGARKLRKTAVAKVEPQPPPAAPTQEGAQLLGMIDRLLDRPDFPVEKLKELLTMQKEMKGDQAKRAYNAAFAEMQPNLPITVRRGEIKHGDKLQSKYAKWEDVADDIMPVLADYGFGLSFRTKNEPGKVTVTGVLAHRDGHAEDTTLELPADTTGSKNAVQAIGSSVSYGKRYTASALLNLVSRGEDDDGQKAVAQPSANEPISEAQLNELIALADAVGADKERFCKWAEINSFADITRGKFADAKAKLNAKRKQS